MGKLDTLTSRSHPSDIAQELYGAYVRQAMGKTFDGKPLPTWHELGTNRQDCWIAVVKRTEEIFFPSTR